jgi:hypothetical protein
MTRPKQADNLVKIGMLREEDHSPEELSACLKLAEDHLIVAKTEAFTTTVRYLNAYDAVFQIATAGLRALNLRPSQKAGARAQSVQSLAWTLNVDASVMPVLIQANQTRGQLAYSRTERPTLGKRELATLLDATQTILRKARQQLLAGQAPTPPRNKPRLR